MTDELLYPCGVDLIGIALCDENGDSSLLRPSKLQYRPPAYHEYAKVMPYVISWSELIGAGHTVTIALRPSRNFRVDTIHATGPCELLGVQYLGHEYAPRCTDRGHRRWAYLRTMCQVGQDIRCLVFCVPGLFMLRSGCDKNIARRNAPGGEFIEDDKSEEPTTELELDELGPKTPREGSTL